MRIFVTGAGGQVGHAVMELLEDSHHEALGVSHGPEVGQIDLGSRHDVLGVVTAWKPDAIIHAAAFTNVDECEGNPTHAYLINALGTRFVTEAARRVGAHVTYLSTDYVFDGNKDEPYIEWDVPNPLSVYGASKLAGEREVDPTATIVRTSWVCGLHGPNMVKTVLRLAAGDGPLRFVDDQVGHPTFADDLAAMLLRLTVERSPGVHHVTNSGSVSWYEFAREVLIASKGDPDRVESISSVELDPPRSAPRPANSRLANVAIEAMGLAPMRDFRDPLAELVSRLP